MMRRLSFRWLTPLLWIVTGGVLGFVTGRFGFRAFVLTYSTQWDIVDVLGLLTTLAVALYVQHWVVQQSEVAKSHRVYLVELAGDLRKALSLLHGHMRASTADVNAITEGTYGLNAAAAQLREALAICNMTTSVDVTRLERELRNYRQSLTLGSFPYEELPPGERSNLEAIHARCLTEITRFIVGVHQA